MNHRMAISLETVFSWKSAVGWAAIVPKLAKVTTVCVYDCAGLGHSSKLTKPRTSFDAAADLQRLLTKIGIGPPYVIAGQSLGGMNARAFASKYPDAVAGLILIDSSHPDQLEELAQLSKKSKHIVAAKAGHNIQLEEPDLVLDSILDVVKQVRKP